MDYSHFCVTDLSRRRRKNNQMSLGVEKIAFTSWNTTEWNYRFYRHQRWGGVCVFANGLIYGVNMQKGAINGVKKLAKRCN